MIFVGDIALPHTKAIQLVNLPDSILEKKWFGNLEGCILSNDDGSYKDKKIVFNDKDAIKELTVNFNFSGFGLANNHILDYGTFDNTIGFLQKIGVPFGGLGSDIIEASRPIVMEENGRQIVILNFGWEVIQCKVAKGSKVGVNPLERHHVINTVKNALRDFPDSYIIPFMHWSYELESEPQPFERQLAKELIDMGVAGVIGAHPHRIGGFEVYNDKPILYSLGNWMFKQGYYHDGKLKFPEFCDHEIAFEWDFENNSFSFHFFRFDSNLSTLTYINTEKLKSKTMEAYTPFSGLSDNDYKLWYKKNHYHRNKGLPIYYWEDSKMNRTIKNTINIMRDKLIFFLSKLR